MSAYAVQNGGKHFLLTGIDIFSKFAWAVPLRNKSAETVTVAMESVFDHGRVPKKLNVDMGTEFYNLKFKDLLRRYEVHMYSTFSNLKASICERFNRTLKSEMWMQFSVRGSYKWTDILQDLMSSYNDSKHRTIKMKPKDVNNQNAVELLHNVFRNFRVQIDKKSPKYKRGDKVRIRKYKNVFEKGYPPNWTTEIFTVNEVKRHTTPVTYKLQDYKNQPIEGDFYEEELTPVENPDIYLVEKVLKKPGN